MQLNAGQIGAQAFESRHEGIGNLVAGAIVQLGDRRRVRIGLQRLQPGEKRRDTDAAGDPDLPGLRVAAGEVEAAIRPFHTYLLPRLQAHSEAAGVITERLDLEADEPVATVGTGDGEGVRTFLIVEGDEGELAGAVPVPESSP